MKMRRVKLLSVFLIYFLVQQGVLVHSSTGGHSFAVRTDGVFEESNFTTTSESDKIAVGSDQYEVQIANNNLAVSSAPTRDSPIVEEPSHAAVGIDGDQDSGPGVATFIFFFIVIAWLTTSGGPKEN